MQHRHRQRGIAPRLGFTLIEILIVISIIALLSSLVTAGVLIARKNANKAVARLQVNAMDEALRCYLQDEGTLPAAGASRDSNGGNAFAELYAALWGTRRPAGPGGRSAPYGDLPRKYVVIRIAETGDYRKATREERRRDAVAKYVIDPWGKPYVYRVRNFGRTAEAEIYSVGPDGVDDTAAGRESSDDIGNWD